jgi:hypothetical protein
MDSASGSKAPIPLTPVDVQPVAGAHRRDEPPYRLFIASSLALALGGGFALAVALPAAQVMELDWGDAWPALVQAHGQLQLLGFAGLFVMGMAFRLMPRFSGRALAYGAAVVPLLVAVTFSIVVRALAQPWGSGPLRGALLLLSATALVAAALAFVAVIFGTLLGRGTRAEATGWYFCLGAVAYVAQAALNLAITVEMARDDLRLAPFAKDQALATLQLFGFVMLFIGGVATRAVPALTGSTRNNLGSRASATALATGVAGYTAAALWAAYRAPTEWTVRIEGVGLLGVAAALFTIASLTGALRPRANRVAQASRAQFHFVRAAMAWLTLVALLLAWYAARALRHDVVLNNFQTDAVRHLLTLGVITMMIVGMALLVVPELAGRRLQHPREGAWTALLLVALNLAVVLRAWPALRGLEWIEPSRYWPMAIAGVLAVAVVATFAAMIGQSYFEQRPRDWASAAALATRKRTPPHQE